MNHPGKALEAAARKLRPHLIPSHRLAYRKLVARGLRERDHARQIVCFDFADQAIDAVGGRYYFSLVRDVIDAGYFPVFIARRITLSSFGTSQMKSLLLDERLGVIRSLAELKEPYFWITDGDGPPPALAEKVVKVSYQTRLCEGEDEIAFPVFVHPQISMKTKLPYPYAVEAKRPARIFFGGNTEEGKYDKNVIRDVYDMLTRRDMLGVVTTAMNGEPIHRPQEIAGWLPSAEFHPFVLCETQHGMIPQERWLEALAKADFFLACPGVGMPLCHNLIEALAAGSVPILQYAAYLTPPLKDRVNCMAFHDAASLRDVIDAVLAMSHQQIQSLRENVRAYYEEFLAPGCFTRRLFSGSQTYRTLLANAYRVPR